MQLSFQGEYHIAISSNFIDKYLPIKVNEEYVRAKQLPVFSI